MESSIVVSQEVALGAFLVGLGHKGDCKKTVRRLLQCDGTAKAIGTLLRGQISFYGKATSAAFAKILNSEITSSDLWEMLIPIVRAKQSAVAVQWTRLTRVLESHVAVQGSPIRLVPQPAQHSAGHHRTSTTRELVRA